MAYLAAFVYFVQGAVSLAAIAFPLLLRGKGWGVSQISTFSFIVGLPWTLKIFYGALTDGVPITGLRRKPYIILSSIISIFSWAGLSYFHHHKFLLYFFAIASNVGFAMTDVVADALIVERSNETNAKIYQSICWGSRSIGAILGGFLGGWLANRIPYIYVIALSSLLPITTLACGILIPEPEAPHLAGNPIFYPIKQSLSALFKGDLKWFSLLLLIVSFSAAFNTPSFFYLKEKLGFSETFLGTLTSLAWIGATLGCLIYAKLLKDVPLRTMLAWAIGINAVNVLSSFLVVSAASAATLSFFGGITSYLSFLPLISAATVLSRQKGIEGSLFAVLMSVNNLGQLLATFVGGILFDIIGLKPLILLSAGVGLIGYWAVNRLKMKPGGNDAS